MKVACKITEDEYRKAIPHFCSCRTVADHVDYLMLCWGISYGYVQKRHDVEGPHYCHGCDLAVRAKRWIPISDKKKMGR